MSYRETILPYLLEQYRNSEKLQGIIGTVCDQADDIEVALQEIRDTLTLATATGVNLDLIGRVYGVPRNLQADEDYRTNIRYKAALSVNGTPDEILTFLDLAYGTPGAYYVPQYPAAFAIVNAPGLTTQALEPLCPAGVGGFAGTYLTTVEGVHLATVDGDDFIVPGA